ncbi:ABC transporter substrate-binding protein [Deinococcus pimensis]|uniref:ABC transporter substrate-binding protein n=1 Tax=Deinococcus pimensis TaxID=309888 RepID=UPI0004AEC488|nr:iron-siderophore ABC transporter substrate-binding protein [Deinococcus pimensis]
MPIRPLLTTLLLALTTIAAATSYPVTITHDLGTATLPKKPTRIVALGPHALDLLLSLGIQPVGYGEASTYLATPAFGSPIRNIKYLGSRVTTVPTNVGDRYHPNLEILMTLKPDLIVGENYASEAYPQLTRIAPTLLFKGTDRDEWQRTLPLIARATDREKNYAAVLKRYQQGVTDTRQKLSKVMGDKKVLVVWTGGGDGRNLFNISDSGDWTGGLLEDLGLHVIDANKRDATVGVEGLGAMNADAIVVLASGNNTPTRARADWTASALASRLPASRAGRVYFFDYHLFRRLRGPIAAELIERQLLRTLAER